MTLFTKYTVHCKWNYLPPEWMSIKTYCLENIQYKVGLEPVQIRGSGYSREGASTYHSTRANKGQFRDGCQAKPRVFLLCERAGVPRIELHRDKSPVRARKRVGVELQRLPLNHWFGFLIGNLLSCPETKIWWDVDVKLTKRLGKKISFTHHKQVQLVRDHCMVCPSKPRSQCGGNVLGSPPVWVRTCLLRSNVSLNPFPQKVHGCLLVSLWHLRWRFSMRCNWKVFWHTWHSNWPAPAVEMGAETGTSLGSSPVVTCRKKRRHCDRVTQRSWEWLCLVSDIPMHMTTDWPLTFLSNKCWSDW